MSKMLPSLGSLLKELYNPLKPDCVLAHEKGELSDLEEMLFESEIKEYYAQPHVQYLAYDNNPWLTMIPKSDSCIIDIPVPLVYDVPEAKPRKKKPKP